MRVTMAATTNGPRLAVRSAGQWIVSDDPGTPRTVDELVLGGPVARRRAERIVGSGSPATRSTKDICVPWPTKILCIGLNYRKHAAEAGLTPTSTPTMFNKFNNSLSAAGAPVRLPTNFGMYDYEVELGVVIGRRAVRVAEEDALDYVWGYCSCNDLTSRELQSRTSQFMLGKALEGFLPVGPELVSADEVGDPQLLWLRTWLNGELRQDSNTADMIFSVAELVSYISQHMPLEPGDFIATGTPGGVIMGRDPKVWMKPGDVVEVEVEGLGRLTTLLVVGD